MIKEVHAVGYEEIRVRIIFQAEIKPNSRSKKHETILMNFLPFFIKNANHSILLKPLNSQFSLVPPASSCPVIVLQNFYSVENMLYATSLSICFIIMMLGLCFSPADWELSVQEPWNQKIPTGTGLSAAAGHRNHNHTTGM